MYERQERESKRLNKEIKHTEVKNKEEQDFEKKKKIKKN